MITPIKVDDSNCAPSRVDVEKTSTDMLCDITAKLTNLGLYAIDINKANSNTSISDLLARYIGSPMFSSYIEYLQAYTDASKTIADIEAVYPGIQNFNTTENRMKHIVNINNTSNNVGFIVSLTTADINAETRSIANRYETALAERKRNADVLFSDPEGLSKFWLWIHASFQEEGSKIIEKTANLVKNIGDVDYAEIQALDSIRLMLNIEGQPLYNYDYPIELKNVLDIFSVKQDLILTNKNAINTDIHSVHNSGIKIGNARVETTAKLLSDETYDFIANTVNLFDTTNEEVVIDLFRTNSVLRDNCVDTTIAIPDTNRFVKPSPDIAKIPLNIKKLNRKKYLKFIESVISHVIAKNIFACIDIAGKSISVISTFDLSAPEQFRKDTAEIDALKAQYGVSTAFDANGAVDAIREGKKKLNDYTANERTIIEAVQFNRYNLNSAQRFLYDAQNTALKYIQLVDDIISIDQTTGRTSFMKLYAAGNVESQNSTITNVDSCVAAIVMTARVLVNYCIKISLEREKIKAKAKQYAMIGTASAVKTITRDLLFENFTDESLWDINPNVPRKTAEYKLTSEIVSNTISDATGNTSNYNTLSTAVKLIDSTAQIINSTKNINVANVSLVEYIDATEYMNWRTNKLDTNKESIVANGTFTDDQILEFYRNNGYKFTSVNEMKNWLADVENIGYFNESNTIFNDMTFTELAKFDVASRTGLTSNGYQYDWSLSSKRLSYYDVSAGTTGYVSNGATAGFAAAPLLADKTPEQIRDMWTATPDIAQWKTSPFVGGVDFTKHPLVQVWLDQNFITYTNSLNSVGFTWLTSTLITSWNAKHLAEQFVKVKAAVAAEYPNLSATGLLAKTIAEFCDVRTLASNKYGWNWQSLPIVAAALNNLGVTAQTITQKQWNTLGYISIFGLSYLINKVAAYNNPLLPVGPDQDIPTGDFFYGLSKDDETALLNSSVFETVDTVTPVIQTVLRNTFQPDLHWSTSPFVSAYTSAPFDLKVLNQDDITAVIDGKANAYKWMIINGAIKATDITPNFDRKSYFTGEALTKMFDKYNAVSNEYGITNIKNADNPTLAIVPRLQNFIAKPSRHSLAKKIVKLNALTKLTDNAESLAYHLVKDKMWIDDTINNINVGYIINNSWIYYYNEFYAYDTVYEQNSVLSTGFSASSMTRYISALTEFDNADLLLPYAKAALEYNKSRNAKISGPFKPAALSQLIELGPDEYVQSLFKLNLGEFNEITKRHFVNTGNYWAQSSISDVERLSIVNCIKYYGNEILNLKNKVLVKYQRDMFGNSYFLYKDRDCKELPGVIWFRKNGWGLPLPLVGYDIDTVADYSMGVYNKLLKTFSDETLPHQVNWLVDSCDAMAFNSINAYDFNIYNNNCLVIWGIGCPARFADAAVTNTILLGRNGVVSVNFLSFIPMKLKNVTGSMLGVSNDISSGFSQFEFFTNFYVGMVYDDIYNKLICAGVSKADFGYSVRFYSYSLNNNGSSGIANNIGTTINISEAGMNDTDKVLFAETDITVDNIPVNPWLIDYDGNQITLAYLFDTKHRVVCEVRHVKTDDTVIDSDIITADGLNEEFTHKLSPVEVDDDYDIVSSMHNNGVCVIDVSCFNGDIKTLALNTIRNHLTVAKAASQLVTSNDRTSIDEQISAGIIPAAVRTWLDNNITVDLITTLHGSGDTLEYKFNVLQGYTDNVSTYLTPGGRGTYGTVAIDGTKIVYTIDRQLPVDISGDSLSVRPRKVLTPNNTTLSFVDQPYDINNIQIGSPAYAAVSDASLTSGSIGNISGMITQVFKNREYQDLMMPIRVTTSGKVDSVIVWISRTSEAINDSISLRFTEGKVELVRNETEVLDTIISDQIVIGTEDNTTTISMNLIIAKRGDHIVILDRTPEVNTQCPTEDNPLGIGGCADCDCMPIVLGSFSPGCLPNTKSALGWKLGKGIDTIDNGIVTFTPDDSNTRMTDVISINLVDAETHEVLATKWYVIDIDLTDNTMIVRNPLLTHV